MQPVSKFPMSLSSPRTSLRASRRMFQPSNVAVKLSKPRYIRPDPYLLGAKRCGVDPTRCLVVEDAPAGVRSGNAAGSKTLALITSHTKEQVEAASPTFIVKDLSRSVGVSGIGSLYSFAIIGSP